MKQKITGMAVLFLLAAILTAAGTSESAAPEFRILYSGSLNGNLDGCDCKTNKKAGLVKRAAYLRENYSSEHDILISGGDFSDTSEDGLLSDLIHESLSELDYRVLALGDQEFMNGCDDLGARIAGHPYLCGNLSLVDNESATRKLHESIRLECGGVTVAISAVIDPQVFFFYPETIKNGIEVVDPLSFLQENWDDSDEAFRILVYHGPESGARALLEGNMVPDLLILVHEQKLLDEVIAGGSLLVSPGEQGNRLGMVTVKGSPGNWSLENRFRLFEWEKDPDDPAIRARIDAYIEQMRSRIKKAP